MVAYLCFFAIINLYICEEDINMDIQHIKYFLEVVRCKSFSNAADNLYVTQPILSRCIKNLEMELQVPLINRSTKSFALTDAGKVLYTYGMKLVEEHQDIYRHIRDMNSSDVGELHISSPGILMDMYFPRLVTEYRKQYPGIRISISERGSRSTEKDISDGNADVGLVMLPLENPQDFNIFPIISDEVCVLVRREHDFAKKSFIHLKQLQDVEIITYNQSNTLYHTFWRMCQEQGFLPNITYQSMMPNFIMDVISYGDCVGVLPGPMLRQFQTEKLVSVPIRPRFPWEIAMITKKDRYLPNAVNSFMNFAQQFLSSHLI